MKVTKNLFACAFCKESFPNPNYLVTHVQQKHTSVKISEDKNHNKNNKIEDEKDKSPNIQFKLFQKDQNKAGNQSKDESNTKLPDHASSFGAHQDTTVSPLFVVTAIKVLRHQKKVS